MAMITTYLHLLKNPRHKEHILRNAIQILKNTTTYPKDVKCWTEVEIAAEHVRKQKISGLTISEAHLVNTMLRAQRALLSQTYTDPSLEHQTKNRMVQQARVSLRFAMNTDDTLLARVKLMLWD